MIYSNACIAMFRAAELLPEIRATPLNEASRNLSDLLEVARVVDQLLQPHHDRQHDDTPLIVVNGAELTYGTLRKLRAILKVI